MPALVANFAVVFFRRSILQTPADGALQAIAEPSADGGL
jgi:hypothetical protein